MDKRTELLRAASELFAQDGYHRTSVQSITARAGVATGTFYLYFSSKDSCFLAIIDDLYGRLMQAVLEARAGQAGARGKLLASTEAAALTFLSNPLPAGLILKQRHGGEHTLAERVAQVEEDLCTLVAADLSDLAAATKAEALAAFLVGGLELLLGQALDGTLPIEPQQLADSVKAFVSRLIA